MASINVFKLLMLGLRVQWQESCEFGWVLWRYKSHYSFIISYCFLSLLYLFSSPYTVSRRYLKWNNADDVYGYGETPLSVLADIIDKAEVKAGMHVFELGAGSGYTSLWLHQVSACKVTAIELIPGFARRLRWTGNLLGLKGIEIRTESFLDTCFQGAEVIYLYASNLDEDIICQLVVRLSKLSKGTRIITISYPLQPFACDSVFEVRSCFEVSFPWGKAEVFVQDVI